VNDRYARNLIVVGASAGGVEALREFVAVLPSDLLATVMVVLHLPAGGTSALPAILSRSGPLPAYSARDGMRIEQGAIYVAPPNHHMLLVHGALALSHGPTENGRRPAINALFRSAAIVGGPRIVGVLLSGVLDDGVAGLVSIASRGGKTLVQDPDDALHPGMPQHAIRTLAIDHVLPVKAMGSVLDKLSREEVELNDAPAPSAMMRLENEIATTDASAQTGRNPDRLGHMSGFTCPDCDGGLVELTPGSRYRCRIGHAWTAEALLDAQGAAWERALWAAIRTLNEKASLSRRMADHARERGNGRIADRYDLLAAEALDAAALLRAPMQVAGHREPSPSTGREPEMEEQADHESTS
jgi:two-component system, chemotaxis family, protein-glutamate methylesterase/glutaminase